MKYLTTHKSNGEEVMLCCFKVSKIRWQKHAPPKPSVQKKTPTQKRPKQAPLVVSVPKNVSKKEAFPQWLVDLMVNIEEAKTHQLVVE